MHISLNIKNQCILFITVLTGTVFSACAQMVTVSSPVPTHTIAAILTSNISQTPPPPTPTPLLAPSTTFTELPTGTTTGTSTETPILFNYVFPIQPPSAAGFAEGTASHGYPATDIFALVGTKYVAVTDGIVDFVSYTDTWDPINDDPTTRGGLSVAIIGEDGVRYYGSHLSAIANGIQPGVRVGAGQLLGLVGKTGDARNTTSHLHFGISRPSTPDDWKARRGQVDPFPFLQVWKDGHNVTPPLPTP